MLHLLARLVHELESERDGLVRLHGRASAIYELNAERKVFQGRNDIVGVVAARIAPVHRVLIDAKKARCGRGEAHSWWGLGSCSVVTRPLRPLGPRGCGQEGACLIWHQPWERCREYISVNFVRRSGFEAPGKALQVYARVHFLLVRVSYSHRAFRIRKAPSWPQPRAVEAPAVPCEL